MKISIVGAGAMGSRFGYMLHEAGNEVILIDAWHEHVESINKKGLIVNDNGLIKKVKIPAVLPERATETPDLIILFTKSMGLEPMLESIKGILGKNTKVLCLLNGLGHNETIEKYVNNKNIFMGVTLWTASLKGPGHVELSGGGNLEIQNIDPEMKECAKQVCDIFNDARLNAIYSENVLLSIWRKACVNGAINSSCTILDCNIKQFGKLKQAPRIIRSIIKEFSDVANKFGVKLDVEEVARLVESTYDPSKAGEHYPSMHQDLIQNGRYTEIDYINGYISKKGKEFNIDTLYNDLITNLIHGKEELIIS